MYRTDAIARQLARLDKIARTNDDDARPLASGRARKLRRRARKLAEKEARS